MRGQGSRPGIHLQNLLVHRQAHGRTASLRQHPDGKGGILAVDRVVTPQLSEQRGHQLIQVGRHAGLNGRRGTLLASFLSRWGNELQARPCIRVGWMKVDIQVSKRDE